MIDNAQKNITELASQVTSLQKVLDNKQRRGAFGQGRMEAIVQDGLPRGSYEFQPHCRTARGPIAWSILPDQRPLVIDAKFPLEAFTAYREARTDEERKAARRSGCARTSASISPTSPANISSPARPRTRR